MRDEHKAALFLTAAVFLFSAMGTLVKIAGSGIPATEAVFIRGLVGVVLLFAVSRHKGVPVTGTRRGLLVIRGLAGTAATILLYFAVARMPVADALLLNQATPIFVLPLAALFLRERITVPKVLFTAMALAGAALVLRPAGSLPALAGLAAILSALFAALAYILVRELTATEASLAIVFWFNAVATVCTAPAACILWVTPTLPQAAALAAGGLCASAGQILLTAAYRRGEVGRLAVIGSAGAVFGALFDWLLWRHAPDLTTVAGGALIIAACSFAQQRKNGSIPGRRV